MTAQRSQAIFRLWRSMCRPRSSLFVPLLCLAPAVVVIAVGAPGRALAQNCELLSGPARTDCQIGRARILGQQSSIAAGVARQRAGVARLGAATGTHFVPKRHRTKRKHGSGDG